MKTPKTDAFINEGIYMRKCIDEGYSGLFSSKPPTYDYKTVYDLEEAIKLNCNHGWEFIEEEGLFYNLIIRIFRDLKNK